MHSLMPPVMAAWTRHQDFRWSTSRVLMRMMGLSAKRTLGKSKDWKGSDEQFDSWTHKYSAWLGGVPGNVEQLLEAVATNPTPIVTPNLDVERLVMAERIHQPLQSLVDGKAPQHCEEHARQ